ncbi:Anaerobic dimethyl sulfoxide reductase chain B [Posidoniimonas corsicana]|uniref:Anaerobic dimethyl sulfoxide reductase chain B n=1 Tax=Posidoniimonas corsicana TaxID=1938618 RepID=A0A5C5UXI5_9BACT|nr:DmsC/YnfH family molybdoenzyme membrane anchor subunit [Posidoniimonas corsicana]TWT31076.1 Anaerobic dimethyl sulfoxide reductase chain B [Posidoniimonas corsicana]
MSALTDAKPEAIGGGSLETGDLIGALLAESRELTAVERFAKQHDAGDLPAQAKHYRDLVPLTKPGAGQQYAFEVDLDQCSGCKACVSACHSLNGLEPTETWRSVGQLHGQNGLPIIQHVTTACHHCVDPGCLNGCPTNAYEKDPETGIVRHLDDQCFGCQYCTMTCPYEVPQYSESKGIVRKCDMCHGRLAEGEAPACVQACPNQAIKITVVDVAQTVSRTNAGAFLPATPPSMLTNPTTVFKSSRSLPADLLAADANFAKPQHAHLPLVLMLVLTQMSVGAVAFGAMARWAGFNEGAGAAIVLGVLAGLGGLGLAPLHLGRPHLAFRSILGWRHSWLSREAIVFGVYAPMAMAAAAYVALPYVESYLPELIQSLLGLALPGFARPAAEVLAVAAGAAGVFCSAMIYIFTGREFWRGVRTFARFFGSAVVLGPAFTLACVAAAAAATAQTSSAGVLAAATVLATVGKLAYETRLFLNTSGSLPLTARLMKRDLRPLTLARVALAVFGGVLTPMVVGVAGLGSWGVAAMAVVGFGGLLLGEFAERALYFSAVIPLKMPGGVKS